MSRQNHNLPPLIEQIDVLGLVRRYRALIATSLAVSCSLFLLATFILSPKFKSSATITIYTKYFQNPLVKDFLPELYDTSELRAQRENLIRQSFGDDFIVALGNKYKVFRTKPDTPERAVEIDEFRKRIETNSTQSTTFTVSFTYKDQAKTYDIEREIVERVVETLAEERRATITKIRDSIQRRVEAISLNSNGSNPDPMASARPELLVNELAQLEEQIRALENQYTSAHPKVAKLRNRQALIQSWLKKTGGGKAKSYDKAMLIDGQPRAVTKEVYEDLLKKLNYLNILLDMDQDGANDYVAILSPPSRPLSPVWPNKPMFLLWGMLVGLLISSTVILVTEYFERTMPTPREFARELDLPFLGSLPRIKWSEINAKPRKVSGKKKQVRFEEWN